MAQVSKVKIYADGGSRGNPGVAGSGTVIYSGDGQTILKEIVYVVGTKHTNNVAEYHGLLRGLEAARELGAAEVEFYMDSKLVVEQVNGRWKIKHPDMQKLALEARRIINDFDSFSLEWVPRAKNKVADALSNDAMDAAASGHPEGIVGGAEPADEPADAPAPETPEAPVTAGDFSFDRGEVTSFVLLRHGQTEMTRAKQYAGHADPALDEAGRRQAAAAAQELAHRVERGALRVDAIVSSPLRRCKETAAVVAKVLPGELEVREVPELIEVDFGAWDGMTFAEAHARDPELHERWLTDNAATPPGGESLQTLHRRVRAARQQLQRDFAGKTVLVVTHVNPIKSFLRQGLDAGPTVFHRMFLSPASLSTVDFFDGGNTGQPGGTVTSFNDCGHLAGLG